MKFENNLMHILIRQYFTLTLHLRNYNREITRLSRSEYHANVESKVTIPFNIFMSTFDV